MHVGLPRTSPEQRDPLYEDVETLIDYGFLTKNLSINRVPLSLRSLGPVDRFMLRHRTYGLEHDEWRAVAVASSIWMIGGYNLLSEPNVVPRLTQMVMNLPPNIRTILFNDVMSLFDRVNESLDAVESYAYEKTSRYKWKSMGNQSFGSHTGLIGHQGTNHAQRMWSFYNIIEDQRVADDTLWEGFKFNTSAHSPKGVKKVDEKDRQNRSLEQDRRQRVQDTFFYTVKGVVPKKDQNDKKTSGVQAGGAKSADDLAEEMRRWVAGEADWHDEIVNQYKHMIAGNYEKFKQEGAKRAAVLAAARAEDEDSRPQSMVAYTPDQLAEILKDRGHGAVPGVRQVGSGPAVVREHLYTKFLGREADAGVLQVREDGQMAIVDPNARVPLDQQISGRTQVYRSEPDSPDDTSEPLPNEW